MSAISVDIGSVIIRILFAAGLNGRLPYSLSLLSVYATVRCWVRPAHPSSANHMIDHNRNNVQPLFSEWPTITGLIRRSHLSSLRRFVG